MHVSDGILPAPMLAGGFVVAGALSLWGARGMREEETPRVAIFTAAFFCASLVHFKMPPISVHLLFNGLLGVVLGRRALLAIPVGLGLQAVLLGHGGITTLGVNAAMFGLAACAASVTYRKLCAWKPERHGVSGAVAAGVAVLASGLLLMLVIGSLGEGFRVLAHYALLAHLPILAIEAVVTGFIVEFLQRVKPALLLGVAS
jgi:cobalt/nickel transport system permease protein